jgi:hypothetical protein
MIILHFPNENPYRWPISPLKAFFLIHLQSHYPLNLSLFICVSEMLLIHSRKPPYRQAKFTSEKTIVRGKDDMSRIAT